MKKMKRTLALLLAACMLLGLLCACDSAEKPSDGPDTPDASGTPVIADEEYPITPEELGSGEVRWSEEKTADGWMKVTNDGGETLGYAPDSGVKLIQVGGYAFKDLNRNGKLDLYEDWRQEDNARAADLAGQLTEEQMAGLMLSAGASGIVSGKLTEDQTAMLGQYVRTIMNRVLDSSYETYRSEAVWSNAMQAYAESMELGIPINFTTDPRSDGSYWPQSLGIAASFDPDLANEMSQQKSKEYRALGIGTLLGPQVELATEPRWERAPWTFGEDPALVRDMSNANINGYQSTYDENGTDLGWGEDSIIAMMKHYPGDGAAQSGRESHMWTGKFNVYPGGQFETQLLPFVDAGLNLDGLTGSAAAVMPSYSAAWSDDGSLGEIVGSAFSEYKLNLLRSYGFDGVICTDWNAIVNTGWGDSIEGLSIEEKAYMTVKAGVDQLGGVENVDFARGAIKLLKEDLGDEAALARIRESMRRIVKNSITIGLFENAYLNVEESLAVLTDKDAKAAAFEAQLKSIVMLKNDGAIADAGGSEKPTVYVPLVYTPSEMYGAEKDQPSTVEFPVDKDMISKYVNLVTDTVSETLTGPADENGNPTVAYEDIIRASKDELASCDYALVFARFPHTVSTGGWESGIGWDIESESFIPISLQYGEYTANSDGVRKESIAGSMVETTVETPYGSQQVLEKRNESYYGKSSIIGNTTDLDMIFYACENMPEDGKVIVSVNSETERLAAMIFSEFEEQVDAILISWNADMEAVVAIATGQAEPSALLPLQMPANMETVEAQYEDVPRDMECYVDSAGNTYDFGFGLNWSGVIQDARTEKYCVPPLTTPEAQLIK